MNKRTQLLLLFGILLFLLLLTVVTKDTPYRPLHNGQEISTNWLLHLEEISPSRRKVILVNKETQAKVVVFNYLLYSSEMSLVGKTFQKNGVDYFIARIDNEGSLDTFYYTVYRLTPNEGKRLTENNYVWACSNPIKKRDELRFYGDIFSEHSDCFFLLSNVSFFKKEVAVIRFE